MEPYELICDAIIQNEMMLGGDIEDRILDAY